MGGLNRDFLGIAFNSRDFLGVAFDSRIFVFLQEDKLSTMGGATDFLFLVQCSCSLKSNIVTFQKLLCTLLQCRCSWVHVLFGAFPGPLHDLCRFQMALS